MDALLRQRYTPRAIGSRRSPRGVGRPSRPGSRTPENLMRAIMIWLGVVAVVGLVLLSGAARADDKKPDEKKKDEPKAEKIAPDKLPKKVADAIKGRFPK